MSKENSSALLMNESNISKNILKKIKEGKSE